MTPTLRIGAAGFGLIAVCYGFARFAFGLFLPRINEDISLSLTLAGVISGGAFAVYCVAIVASARLSERLGPRRVAGAAALIAAVGMLGIALSSSAVRLAIFVVLAGISTGLASPPMADAVGQAVSPSHRDLTNTVINSGTSAGVVLSGSIALWVGDDWRLVFMVFAGTALVLAIMTFIALPTSVDSVLSEKCGGMPPLQANSLRLVAAAFLMGASSTALWSFGGVITSLRLGWSTEQAGLLWIAIGAGGVFGAAAGWLTSRLGINRAHRISLVTLAASIGIVGLAFTTPFSVLIGGALFGAAYVMLTGVYLVWGTAALPDQPATGLMVGFLAIAVGQMVGAPLFGLLMDHFSLQTAVVTFSLLCMTSGLFWFETGTLRDFRGDAAVGSG